MPVFTCAEMVAACIAGEETGWRRFITDYLPFAGLLLERHYPGLAGRREGLLREVLLRARDQDLRFFRDYRGHSEREFLVHLRDHVLGVLEEAQPAVPPPEVPLSWEAFEQAFEKLTALEKQVVWLYLLSPRAEDTALMLRADRPSVEAILGRAQEQLRAAVDHWSAEMLEQNRHVLVPHARERRTKECPEPATFLRLLDGQNPWRVRYGTEQHLAGCWHCVDLLCRFREAARLARLAQPLSEDQAERFAEALGFRVAPPKWKRLLGLR